MNIGFALTGSFCTHAAALKGIADLTKAGHTVTPILSEHAGSMDTRFGTADALRQTLCHLTGQSCIDTILAAEPIGPQALFDVLVVAPCTGNTLAKLAHGITDTCVTMAVKSHLRIARPALLAVSTNDGLSAAAANIGLLLARRHYYFVPFRQDAPQTKPCSLVADFTLLPEALFAAADGRQLQPVLLAPQT